MSCSPVLPTASQRGRVVRVPDFESGGHGFGSCSYHLAGVVSCHLKGTQKLSQPKNDSLKLQRKCYSSSCALQEVASSVIQIALEMSEIMLKLRYINCFS